MAAPDPSARPVLHEWRVPPSWQAIDIISDLHLSEATPRTFEAFRAHLLGTPADAVVILGDLFEAWVGDDARHAGFEARCTASMAQAAGHLHLAFMAGNRDFLAGPQWLAAAHAAALPDPTVATAFGQRLLLTHGDALCLSDQAYQAFRAQVRDPAWRRAFLARPLDERQALGRSMRAESERRKQAQAPGEWFDVDRAAAVAWLRAAGATRLVHGHTHRPADETMGDGRVRHVLTDWDLDRQDGGPPRAEVLRWTPSGLQRVAPAGPPAAPR